MLGRCRRWFAIFILFLVLCFTAGAAAILYLDQDLPDVETLKHVRMQVPLRIYTADHKLIGEYGEKRRIPVQLKDIPTHLVNAVIATEDRRFWHHSGVDMMGLARAGVQLIITGHKTQGGSTITMQVARNFFLTRKKTYIRKLREILLSLKMTRELSKQKVLELYLNKVYFGQRAYGVAAAAQIYYGAELNQLTLPQMAMLAGLPKAPSAINPLSNPKAAFARRHHVLQRMLEQNYISQQEFTQADKTPLTASRHYLRVQVNAPYVAEEVRDELVNDYGTDVYAMGLTVYTTIDSHLQNAANNAVHGAILAYDKRHGYRGAISNWGTIPPEQYDATAKRLRTFPIYNSLRPALVIGLSDEQATVLLADGQQANLAWSSMQWAGKALAKGRKGSAPAAITDVLQQGDVVYVTQTKDTSWQLSQIPQAEGALVAINPNNGGIQALVGGFSYVKSKFDRVMQAQRQPGSGFKPFVYSAALNKGFTLASLINDAPIVTRGADNVKLWRPQNDTRQFYGPTRLRVGLMKSRNLVTIRLLQEVGVGYTVNYAKRFGFAPASLPRDLTLALGAGDLTPWELATGYTAFANGGYKVDSYLISKILDSNAQVIKQVTPKTVCDNCEMNQANADVTLAAGVSAAPDEAHLSLSSAASAMPNSTTSNKVTLPIAPRIIPAQNAYLITSALQSVIQSGTGRAAKVLGRRDLSGKTGTTNDQRDAWFNGFNRNLVVVTWMGFDQPKSLYEYGAQAALPMWIAFMREALKGKPEMSLARPADLVTLRINPDTGLAAGANDKRAIFETFRQQFAPKAAAAKPVSGGESVYSGDASVY